MKKYSDKIILGISIILIVVGTLLVFSASSSVGINKGKDILDFFNRQIVILIAALIAFSVGAITSYKYWNKFGLALLGLIIFALVAVLFTEKINGASRWFRFGSFSVQPSEFAKIVLILYFARLTTNFGEKIKDFKKLLIPLGILGFIMLLIALEPNFSNVFLIGIIGFIMLYIGGARFKHLIIIMGIAGIGLFLAMWFSNHGNMRLNGYLNGDVPSNQVREALIGIGSGGINGIGLGESQQANLFLPEAYNDFIFAILGEELGFIGAVGVSFLYVVFFVMSLITINHIKDEYGKLIVFGLSFNIVLSAMMNMAVVLGLVPTTGITLPFVSYGGSSLVVFIFSVGVILNVNAEGKIHLMILRKLRPLINLINDSYSKIDDRTF